MRIPPALSTACLVVVRAAVAVVMLWAGLAKIPEPMLFAQTVHAYDVLPPALIVPFALAVPWTEVLVGIGLLLGFWTRSHGLVSLLLFLSFGIALGINIARGADMSCGCFALDGTKGGLTTALIRDVVFIGCALVLTLSRRVPLSLDAFLARRQP